MTRKMPLSNLLGQEKRAANLFIILLLTIIFATDVLIVRFIPNNFGFYLLIPYIFLYLLIPVVYQLNKKLYSQYIKYIVFMTFIVVCLANELILFWDSFDYQGGSVVEMFFILFSPIFINKRYFWVVIIGVTIKYAIVGLLLQTMVALWLVVMNLVLALVAYIILNRFIEYIRALNDSYNKQFESTLSTGMAIMNHTIKNEITKIQYLNNQIKDSISNRDTQDVESMMDSIQQATYHMLSMSNRLQAKTGEIRLHEGTHNLNSILNSAVGMLEPTMKNKAQIIQELNGNVDINCDQLQLQEAMMNILMNAVESIESKEGIVTIRLFKVKKDIVIEIEDTGCGIPSDVRSRVFEPFFTTRSTSSNYGLGLSYCYTVIEKHGGAMEIHSEVNVGTKVLIRLPQKRIVHMQRPDTDEVADFHEQDKGIAG